MMDRIEGIRELIAGDKRYSERLKLPVKIFYSPVTWYPVWTGPITVDDIGGGGLKFTTHETIEHNARLKIKIIFPGRDVEPIVVVGQVVWNSASDNRKQLGIKFYKMRPHDRTQYVQYLCDRILLKYL
jgi:hypothetical protein